MTKLVCACGKFNTDSEEIGKHEKGCKVCKNHHLNFKKNFHRRKGKK